MDRAVTVEGRARTSSRLAQLSGPATLVFLLAYLLFWGVHAGAPLGDMVRATLAVLLTQVFPGVVLWRLVRPRRGWWLEDIAIGFGLGAMVAMLVQVLAGFLDLWWLSAVLTLGLAAAILAVPVTRRRVMEAETTPLPWWWVPLVATTVIASIPSTRGYFRGQPLSWPSGSRVLQVDTYLHLALSGQMAHRGPTTFPWVLSEPLGYHYLAHSWVAQVGMTSGAGLDVVLLRFMPLVVPVMIVFAVAAAAVRLSGRAWAGPIAALICLLPGLMNVVGATTPRSPMNPLSPTLGISAPLLITLIVLLVLRWRREAARGSGILVVALACTAAGTKGSTTPLLVAGAGLAIVAMVFLNRALVRRVALDLVLLVVGLVLAVKLIFQGAGGGLHFSVADAAEQTWARGLVPMDTGAGQLTAVAMAAFGVFSTGLVGLVLLLVRRWRIDPTPWLLLGGGAAASGAIALFGHPGASQGYFSLNAVPMLALAATCAIVVLVEELPRRVLWTTAAVSAAGGLVATHLVPALLLGSGSAPDLGAVLTDISAGVLVLIVTMVAASVLAGQQRGLVAVGALGTAVLVGGMSINIEVLRAPAPAPSPNVRVDTTLAVSAAQVRAARWIHNHSDDDDLVMSNRHCIQPRDEPSDGCDSRRWLVAGYSERQVLLEGWNAVPKTVEIAPHGRDSVTVPYWKPDLLRLNDGFIARPTAEAADRLRDMGVRWVYVEYTRPHADTLEPFAQKRFHAPGVDVYELEP